MWTRGGWKWPLIALLFTLVHRTVAEPQFKNPNFERDFKAIQPSDPDPYFAEPTYTAQVSSDGGPVPVSTSLSYNDPIPVPPPVYSPPVPSPVPVYTAPSPSPAPVPVYSAPAPATAPAYSASPSAHAPSYNVPATPISFDKAPPAQGGYYYYYYPTNTPIKDTWKNYLLEDQKLWLTVLIPLIIVALGVPILGILFSGINLATTVGRSVISNDLWGMEGFKTELHDVIERYVAVLESEECMERTICQLGSYAYNVPAKSYLLVILDTFVPDTMKGKMSIFRKSALFGKDKAKCKSFKCSAWTNQ